VLVASSQVPASVPTAPSIAADVSVSATSQANCQEKGYPIVDVADVNLIKFDSTSESDGDPLPYAPYAGK
nr:hypothetical protein [Tanacetum cinerariifolium]